MSKDKFNQYYNVFTEEQAIKITIKHGYDGSEFQTSAWKQRGCLKPDRTLEGLISKLKTIYESVVVEGRGKKRKYILNGKKDEVKERKFNYKGSVATVEDEVMKEYIFNYLSKHSGFTQSYKGWAEVLGFPDTSNYSFDKMVQQIKKLHLGFPTIYNPKEAVSKFIQTINTRNKDVIEKSFQRLEREGRIKVSEVYNIKTIEGKFEEIDKEEYEKLESFLHEMLKSYDITLYAYTQAVTSIFKSDKMRNIVNEINQQLAAEFNIKYFFKSFKVDVLEKTIKKEVSKEEFIQAYINRLIKLSKNRQNKDDYKNSISFWKRFYLLNTLTLLKFNGFNGTDELISKEKKLYLDKIDDFILQVMINLHEKNKKEKVDEFDINKIKEC